MPRRRGDERRRLGGRKAGDCVSRASATTKFWVLLRVIGSPGRIQDRISFPGGQHGKGGRAGRRGDFGTRPCRMYAWPRRRPLLSSVRFGPVIPAGTQSTSISGKRRRVKYGWLMFVAGGGLSPGPSPPAHAA